MIFRRVLTACAALAMCASVTTDSYGQAKPDNQNAEQLKLSKAELTQYKSLTSLVDAVAGGKEPAPADVTLSFKSHFIRSATNVFVPYVLEISRGQLASFPIALYVRAVRKDATSAAQAPAFTDIHFFSGANSFASTGQDTVQLARGMELPPGDFDLFFAMTESAPRGGKTPPKRVVHAQTLTVPDFSGGLTTSSIMLGKSLEEAPQQLTPRQQMEQPFTIGGQKMTPTFTSTFSKADELLFMFLIYNEGATPAGKPDIDVGYTLSRGAETKPFAKMPNTLFNAATLPAEFNLNLGHQVLVAQGLPLTTFAAGDYTLTIGITDRTNNQSVTRTVPFTVTP